MQRHPDVGVPRVQLFLGHIVRLCTDEGLANEPDWVLDSTPMWCFGAVLDTVRLLGDGTGMLVRAWSRATGRPVATLAKELDVGWVTAPSTKGWFGIEWRDGTARDDVVTRLVTGAFRVIEAVRDGMSTVKRGRVARLRRHCWALLRVIEDDLDETPKGGFTVARRVTANRIVSFTDLEARQSRKSRSRPFKGYKLHVLGDAVSGMIAAVCVAPANVHDSKVCPRLARRAKTLRRDLDRLFGDTAYGGSRTRYLLSGMGVGVVAPVQLVPERLDRLDKADFTIDFDAHTAMCPAGEMATSTTVSRSTLVRRFYWPVAVCRACPMQAACLPNTKRGRRIETEVYEQQLQEARSRWEDPEHRLLYRRRAPGERLINSSVRHGARRAASWGLRAANLQAHLLAVAKAA
jgi:hypothetical protein